MRMFGKGILNIFLAFSCFHTHYLVDYSLNEKDISSFAYDTLPFVRICKERTSDFLFKDSMALAY